MRKQVLAFAVTILVITTSVTVYSALSQTVQTETRTSSSATTPAALTSLGAGFNAMAFGPNDSRLYVEQIAGVGNYSLAVFDTSSNTRIANVSLPPYPPMTDVGCSDLIVDDSTGAVYVLYVETASPYDGELVAINGSTNAVTGEVSLPTGICTPSLDSKTNVLWDVRAYPAPGQKDALVGGVFAVNISTGSVVENLSLGFAPIYAQVNPNNGLVYVDGCLEPTAYLCSAERLAVINGTSGSLLTTVDLGGSSYPRIALDPTTGVVYVGEGSQFVAINGTSGASIFTVRPQSAHTQSLQQFAINYVSTIPSLDQVVVSPLNSTYLLVYSGATGYLEGAYSFPNAGGHLSLGYLPMYQGYDADNGELYVLVSQDLLVLHDAQATGASR